MVRSGLVLWFAALASVLLPLSSFAQKQPRIVVVTHGQAADSFWAVVKKGVEAAAAATGSDVEYRAPEKFDLIAMSHLVDAAVASKPDGLVVSIPDAAVLGKSIQGAVKANIPVISINSGWDASRKLGCLMHIGQEEESAGRKAGERLKSMRVKSAVVLNQEVGNVALEQRAKGFSEGFEGPFHKVEILAVTINFTQCRDAIAAYLQKNQDVDGIMALGPVAAGPALQVLESMGKLGKIKVCTFDLSPAILEALVKKQMDFALDQQQWLQGFLPVVFLANYAKYGSIPENDSISTGPNFVTPENAQQVLDLSEQGFR